MQERLFTIHQVADLLGATPREVLEWIRRGWLNSQQLPDGPIRISERSLVRFLKDRGIDIGQLVVSTAAGAGEPAAASGGQATDAAPATDPQGQADHDAAVREMLTGDRALPANPPDGDEAVAEGPGDEWPEAREPEAERTEEEAATEVAAPRDEDAAARNEVAAPRQADETVETKVAPEADMTQEPAAVPAGEAAVEDASATDKATQVAGAILADAVAQAASHIHLESRADGLALRLRVDGLLRDKPNFHRRLPEGLGPRLVERLLQWAGVPGPGAARGRCGRFTQTIDGRRVTFGLSALPTTAGPRLVLAVHDRQVPLPGLWQLGLAEEARRQLQEVLSAEGGGLILVAAPGLAAAGPVLRALAVAMRDPQRCVLTVEAAGDVEIDGACQSRTDPFEGWSFPAAARALAGQNADAIVIEQLRDPITATAAMEAALAGSTVVGAVRAATAPAALALLAEMQLEPWPLASALKAVLSVRSVRRLCGECRKAVETPDELPAEIGIAREQLGPRLHEPVGCERCGNTGYAGTIRLTSVLIPDAALIALIRSRCPADALAAACRGAQAGGLARLAARQLRDGATSLEEIARIF